jgi:hypothetical protein
MYGQLENWEVFTGWEFLQKSLDMLNKISIFTCNLEEGFSSSLPNPLK